MKASDDVRGANWLFLIILLINLALSCMGLSRYISSRALLLLISQAVNVVPAVLYFVFYRKSFDVIEFKKIRFSNVLLCIVFYLCISPLMSFLNAVSLLYSSNNIALIITQMSTEVPFFVGWLLIGVLPAIAEEFVYRGIFYGSYKKTHALGAVILCGLVFGLMHGNLNQFTYACVMGAAFALLYEASGSLLSTMIVHLVVNTFSVCIVYIIPKLMQFAGSLYEAAIVEDPMTAELIERLLGNDFSLESMTSVAVTKTEVLALIFSNALPAAGGTVLAFLVIKLIARRSGRLENLYRIFPKMRKKQQPQYGQPMNQGMYQSQYGQPVSQGSYTDNTLEGSLPANGGSWKDLFTVPLVIAIVLCTADLAVGALMSAGIIGM